MICIVLAIYVLAFSDEGLDTGSIISYIYSLFPAMIISAASYGIKQLLFSQEEESSSIKILNAKMAINILKYLKKKNHY